MVIGNNPFVIQSRIKFGES